MRPQKNNGEEENDYRPEVKRGKGEGGEYLGTLSEREKKSLKL